MNVVPLVSLLLAVDDPGRVVNLVTGEPVVPESSVTIWRVAAVAIGLAAIAGAVAIAVWRLRTSDFDAAERAFVALARRRGLRRGARGLLRRAAAARGCAPVALLVSRQALADALAALRAGGTEGDAARAEAVLGPGA